MKATGRFPISCAMARRRPLAPPHSKDLAQISDECYGARLRFRDDCSIVRHAPRGTSVLACSEISLVFFLRRDPALQPPAIQVDTPNRGSTHRIRAKYAAKIRTSCRMSVTILPVSRIIDFAAAQDLDHDSFCGKWISWPTAAARDQLRWPEPVRVPPPA